MQELSKKELERLYSEYSNKQICEMLGIHQVTLLRYIKAFGIPLKGKGRRSTKVRLIGLEK